MVGLKKSGIYSGILFSHNKEGNPAIWDNMNESAWHYAK